MALPWLVALCLMCLCRGSNAIIDLKQTTFNTVLQALPANQVVLIEFYASWCPACQRFKPTYEKVGAFFEAQADPTVVVARVDCPQEVDLCGDFKIVGYPCMKLGLPGAFIARKDGNLTTFSGKARTPEHIVEWVASEAHASFKYEEKKTPEQLQQPTKSVLESAHAAQYKFDLQDVEVVTVQLFAQATMGLKGAEPRAALQQVMGLFAEAHPSERCAHGASQLLESYSELWPPGAAEPTEKLLDFKICGPSVPDQWVACADNGTNTRGFTCGLWMLLHSLSTRSPAEKSGRLIMDGLTAFVNHFFKCTMCAEHFKALMAKEKADDVQSKHDSVLWIWRAHNLVNARLAALDKKQEAGFTELPKVQFPTVELCPSCRLPILTPDDQDIKWSEDEVYAFLLRFYGSEAGAAAKVTDASKLAVINATKRPEEVVKHRKELPEGGSSTTAGQFTRSTLFFLLLLLAVWWTAARAFHKHRQPYRRSWASDR